MSLRVRLNQDGQGLIAYMLIVFLVTLVFWLEVKDTDVAQALARQWDKISECLSAAFSCTSG
jgi:hypothetical protein